MSFAIQLVGMVLAITSVAALPSLATTPHAVAPRAACAGTGLSGDNNWIACNGSCTGTQTCRAGTATDATGKYKYCGCAGDSGPPVEPLCCHLVARKNGSGTIVLDVRGICTVAEGCAQTDGLVCRLVNEQPVCRP